MHRLQKYSNDADARPVLVFVTYTGIGDLLMALPLLETVRSQFHALPVIPSPYADLARLLRQDGLLEGYLLAKRASYSIAIRWDTS